MGATREKGLRARRAAEIARTTPAVRDGESTMALETGQELAWVMKDKAGTTVGVSAVHRVFDRTRTYCSSDIPPVAVRFPVLKSLNVCSCCERLWKRAMIAEVAASRRASA
jgi:hypothetical protein